MIRGVWSSQFNIANSCSRKGFAFRVVMSEVVAPSKRQHFTTVFQGSLGTAPLFTTNRKAWDVLKGLNGDSGILASMVRCAVDEVPGRSCPSWGGFRHDAHTTYQKNRVGQTLVLLL